MTCSCHHHHHHQGGPLDAAQTAEALLNCPGPIPYPHPSPGCPTPPVNGKPVETAPTCTTSTGQPGRIDPATGACVQTSDPSAGNTYCVTTGKTPKGCGPAGCFPGVHKYTCWDQLGNAEHYTHVDPV